MNGPTDDQSRDPIKANIRNAVFQATQAAVNKEIKDGEDKVLNGGGIQGFIFWIAKLLGIERWVASMFGQPIPDANEVNTVSSRVADAVSTTLTDDKFTFNNKQEFEAGLRNNILNKLARNSTETIPSFDKERMMQVATQAASNVSSQFAGLFDEQGNKISPNPFSLSPTDSFAAQQFTEAFNSRDVGEKKQLAELAGVDAAELSQTQVNVLARTLAHPLAVIDTQQGALKNRGDEAYAEVAERLRSALVGSRGAINRLGNMQLTNEGLAVLADKIAVSVVRDRLGVTADVPEKFQQEMDARQQKVVQEVVERKISGTIQEGIRTQTALGVLAAYKEEAADKKGGSWFSGVAGYFTRGKIDKECPGCIATMEAYYTQDSEGKYKRKSDAPLTEEQKKKLTGAEEKLYKFAADDRKMSLTKKQSEKVGEIVAGVVTETLNKPGNATLNQEQLAPILKEAIASRLNEKEEEINKISPGNSIKTINKNNKDGDILNDIAEGFATAIKNNENRAYEQLQQAQALLRGNEVAFNDRGISSVLAAAGVQHNSTPDLKSGHFVSVGTTPATPLRPNIPTV